MPDHVVMVVGRRAVLVVTYEAPDISLDEEDSFLLTGRFSGYFERGRRLTEE